MVNQNQWNQKAFDYVHEQREKALSCVICGKKLFNHYECVDEFIWKYYGKLMDQIEVRRNIYGFVIDHYTFGMYDGSLHRHHTNYKKGITIPVCSTCHCKIHKSNDPRYTKYLPVDERPKDNNKIVYNLYNPIEMEK